MSLHRDVLRSLTRPDEFFDSQTPSARSAAYVVLAVALLSAVGLAATGTVLDGSITGIATVENPNHLSGFQCEKPAVYEDGGAFEDMEWNPPSGCNESPTMKVDLGGHARTVLVGAAFVSVLAIPLGWLLATVVIHLLTVGETDGDLHDLLAVTGWGFPPIGLLAVARPIIVRFGAPMLSFPDRPGTLGPYVRDVALGFEFLPLAVASVVALGWSCYVLVHAVCHVRDVPVGRALVAVGVPVACALFATFLDPLGGDPRSGELSLYALVIVVMGLAGAYFPRPLIMLNTRLELFGMRNTHDVEPADWYVALYRIGGVGFASFGFLLLGGFQYVV